VVVAKPESVVLGGHYGKRELCACAVELAQPCSAPGGLQTGPANLAWD
jgi:hypothetical protein